MRNICILTLFLSYSIQLFAQLPDGSEIISDPKTGTPMLIRVNSLSRITRDEFPQWIRTVLNLKSAESFTLLKTETDNLGFEHRRYQLTYKGYPVFGAIYIAHFKDNRLVTANGKYPVLPEINTGIQLSETAAFAKALAFFKNGPGEWQLNDKMPQGELMIAPVDGEINGKDFRLGYRFDMYSFQPLKREYVFADVRDGSVFYTINRIHTTDSAGVAKTRYAGIQQISTQKEGADYILREYGRGTGITTLNIKQGTDYNDAVDFTDPDNYWDNLNSESDEAATDAHWGAEKTYDYYLNVHNRESYDNNNGHILSYVHFYENFVNAMWDGERIVFGDGDGVDYFPLTALDVCGHELTHGVTQHTANLVYSKEPGGLNEAFSDIFGTAVEFYANSQNADWLIGEEFCLNQQGFRSMADPNRDQCPDTYGGLYWNAQAGVHTLSGVGNHWFYLLTQGKTGVNDLGRAYDVTGIGLQKAEKIAYRLLTVYLTPYSEYADARFLSQEAAADLYGACSVEARQVASAWSAVGVGPDYNGNIQAAFTPSSRQFCKPAIVKFTNQSNKGIAWEWDFGDGYTSTELNPVHYFSEYGSYTVRLIANGCDGYTDTLIYTACILIDPAADCKDSINAPTDYQGEVSTKSCEGVAFDNGGAQGNYLDNVSSSVFINPAEASSITFTFKSYDIDPNDFMYVDGGNDFLYFMNGDKPELNKPYTFESPTLRIGLSANSLINGTGYELEWSCQYPVGVQAEHVKRFSCYPNPTTGQLTISYSETEEAVYSLYDMLGALKRTGTVSGSENLFNLDISDLPAGIYSLQLKSKSSMHEQRVQVIH